MSVHVCALLVPLRKEWLIDSMTTVHRKKEREPTRVFLALAQTEVQTAMKRSWPRTGADDAWVANGRYMVGTYRPVGSS